MPTKELLITGKVQGVFYRATAKQVANQLNLKGIIKNTEEGNVEATITGNETQLNIFINWCKKGSENALVKKVSITEKEEIYFPDFKVIR